MLCNSSSLASHTWKEPTYLVELSGLVSVVDRVTFCLLLSANAMTIPLPCLLDRALEILTKFPVDGIF